MASYVWVREKRTVLVMSNITHLQRRQEMVKVQMMTSIYQVKRGNEWNISSALDNQKSFSVFRMFKFEMADNVPSRTESRSDIYVVLSLKKSHHMAVNHRLKSVLQ